MKIKLFKTREWFQFNGGYPFFSIDHLVLTITVDIVNLCTKADLYLNLSLAIPSNFVSLLFSPFLAQGGENQRDENYRERSVFK